MGTAAPIEALTRWEYDGQVEYGLCEDARHLRQNRRLRRAILEADLTAPSSR